jgi:hypothetical protein
MSTVIMFPMPETLSSASATLDFILSRGFIAAKDLCIPARLQTTVKRKQCSLWITFLLVLCAFSAHSQTSAASKTTSPFDRAIQRALDEGHDAVLPPHISHLLGISPQEHEVAIKQFVEMGEPIRGFEVSTAEHNNVVLFVESRAQKQSTFYLTSRRGTLRKVLAVIEGVGYARIPSKEDRQAFEKEKQYWADRLKPL